MKKTRAEKLDTFKKFWALQFLKLLVIIRYGKSSWDYYVWNETPYPHGPPFWSQIKWGYEWVFGKKSKKSLNG